MLDDLAYDDSEPPTIGLVPTGVPWDEVKDHIKIAHSPLLAGPDASGQYAGAYSAGHGAGGRRRSWTRPGAGAP